MVRCLGLVDSVKLYSDALKHIFSRIFNVNMDLMFWVLSLDSGLKYELRVWLDKEKTTCVTLLSIPLDVKDFIERWRTEYKARRRKEILKKLEAKQV